MYINDLWGSCYLFFIALILSFVIILIFLCCYISWHDKRFIKYLGKVMFWWVFKWFFLKFALDLRIEKYKGFGKYVELLRVSFLHIKMSFLNQDSSVSKKSKMFPAVLYTNITAANYSQLKMFRIENNLLKHIKNLFAFTKDTTLNPSSYPIIIRNPSHSINLKNVMIRTTKGDNSLV